MKVFDLTFGHIRSSTFSQVILTLFFIEALSLADWIPQIYKNANFSLPAGPAALIPEALRYSSLTAFVWGFLIVSTLAVFGYKNRVIPILMCLFFYMYLALRNSGGAISNNSIAPLWVLIFLAFQPHSADHSKKEHLFTNWMCLFSVCFFFFIAGLFKVVGMFGCLYNEQFLCITDPVFFPNLVSKELVSFSRWSILGDLIFHYPSLFNGLYISATLLEISTILIPFLPRLQHLWAYLIFIFHLMIDLFIGVHFTPSPQINIAVLALFFLNFRDQDENRFNLIRTFAFITIAMIFYKIGTLSQYHGIQSVPGQLMDHIPMEKWISMIFTTLLGIHLLLLVKNPQQKILNLLLVPNIFIFLTLWEKSLSIYSLFFMAIAAYVSVQTLSSPNGYLNKSLYPGILTLAVSLIALVFFKHLDIYLFGCSAALINASPTQRST